MIKGFVESTGLGTDQQAYMTRLAALPAYRPTPDYETVMQRKMEHLAQVQQQSQQQQQQLGLAQNIGHAQVYAHPELMAYSQPEIGHPPSYSQYLSHANRVLYANNVYHHHGYIDQSGVPQSPAAVTYQHVITRPVDRTSSLIIYPTYRTPELSTPRFTSVLSTSENRLHEATLQYRPPPPYPRPSNSTPDLASQAARTKLSESPEVVSHGQMAPASLVTQSRFDQSVENLSQDASNLHLSQVGAKSAQNLTDDVSSTQSDVQIKDSPVHEVAVVGQVITKPPPPYSGHQTRVHCTNYALVQDASHPAHLVRTQSGEYKHMIVGSEYTRPEPHGTHHVMRTHSMTSAQQQQQQQVVGLQNPGYSDQDSDVIDCLDVSRVSSEQGSSHCHSKTSSLDTTSSLSQPLGPGLGNGRHRDSSTSGQSATSSRSAAASTSSQDTNPDVSVCSKGVLSHNEHVRSVLLGLVFYTPVAMGRWVWTLVNTGSPQMFKSPQFLLSVPSLFHWHAVIEHVMLNCTDQWPNGLGWWTVHQWDAEPGGARFDSWCW